VRNGFHAVGANELNVDDHLLVDVGVAHDVAELLETDLPVFVLNNRGLMSLSLFSAIFAHFRQKIGDFLKNQSIIHILQILGT
jgi:hypothetical protein